MAPVSNAGLQVPAKIVMKGNSSITLHERFSNLAPPKSPVDQVPSKSATEPRITARLDIGDFNNRGSSTSMRNGFDLISPAATNGESINIRMRSSRRDLSPSPAKNRFLARRMMSRPAVQEALRDRNKSLRQRLGAKARLGYADRDNLRPMRISPFEDLDTIFRNQRLSGAFRNFRSAGRGFFNYRGFPRRRFGFQRYNNRGYNNGYNRFGRYRNRRFGNNNNNSFTGGSLRPMSRFQQKQKISKEELDEEIDAYMSKTKLHLDTELDTYMADV